MTSIELQYSTDGGLTWTTLATLGSTDTAYNAEGLDGNEQYQFQIGGSNSSGSLPPVGSTNSVVPRPPLSYAVVDLHGGTPVKITNSGFILFYDGSMAYCWSNGTARPLHPLNPGDSMSIRDVDEDGKVIGSESVAAYGSAQITNNPPGTIVAVQGVFYLPPGIPTITNGMYIFVPGPTYSSNTVTSEAATWAAGPAHPRWKHCRPSQQRWTRAMPTCGITSGSRPCNPTTTGWR